MNPLNRAAGPDTWRRMARRAGARLILLAGLLSGAGLPLVLAQAPSAGQFARLVAELSEPGGYFDTDNLISNERSYLDVMSELERRGVAGGVYLGVGPDQNFSYIARVRPAVAVIVDIRRDNLLLHLLFRALFEQAATRLEYLCLLTGRAPPARLAEDAAAWRAAGIDRLAAYVDAAPRMNPDASWRGSGADSPPEFSSSRGAPAPSSPRGAALPSNSGGERDSGAGEPALPAVLRQAIAGFGVPLSAADYSIIARFHQAFVAQGLGLRFQSFGRPVQSYNPTYRDLLTERDREGRQRSFLASEADYQFVRSLARAGRVIPVVGDVAGRKAMPAIAAWMRRERLTLSTLYISNVEDYLFRGGTFDAYMANLKALPATPRSVVIRSVFLGGRRGRSRDSAFTPLPGYASASVVQNLTDMLARHAAGQYTSYHALIGP